MIQGIPNQPIDFVGDDLIGCDDEEQAPLLIAADDTFVFQFILGRCSDASEYINDPDFFADWLTGGEWNVRRNNACAVNGQAGATIEYSGFTTTVGSVYEVEIVVAEIGGSGITVNIGGGDYLIQSPGTHTFMTIVGTDQNMVITLVDDTSSVCLFSAQIYEANTGVSVEFTDPEEDVVFTIDFDTDPEYFQVSCQTVTVIIPVADVDDLPECFKIHIKDNCAAYASEDLCSQTIRLTDNCKGTVKVRVCNDSDQPMMGFVQGYFEARYEMLVILPRFQYEVEEERLSNGYINRHWIDRQEVRDLRVTDVALGTSAHRFLSALSMFDHFYIGEKEYSVDVEDYEPAYPDSTNSLGAVKLTIRPKQELFRKVLCAPVGMGCNPQQDPICNEPDVVIQGSYDIGGKYTYNVQLVSMTGFQTGQLLVSVNGVAQPPEDFSTAPMDIDVGLFDPGDVIEFTVTNVSDPNCNWTTVETVPCECSNGDLFMFLGSTPSPSADFTAATGVAGVAVECVSDRPSWTIAGGAGLGGVSVIFNTTVWAVYDGDGNIFIAGPGNFARPCDVDVWFTSEDGETTISPTDVSFCGGADEECEPCCSDGDLVVSGATTYPALNQTYTDNGIGAGKQSYVNGSDSVYWTAGEMRWIIAQGGPGGGFYGSDEDVELPCQVTAWYAIPFVNAPLENLEALTVCGGVYP